MLTRNFDLVLLADGQRAICLMPAHNACPHLKTLWHMEINPVLDHLEGSERPGRYRSGPGLPKASFEASSRHDAAITAFLHEVASRVHDTLRDAGQKRLAIVASPSALGRLRAVMPKELGRCVVQEIAHDYTRTPHDRVEQILLGSLQQSASS